MELHLSAAVGTAAGRCREWRAAPLPSWCRGIVAIVGIAAGWCREWRAAPLPSWCRGIATSVGTAAGRCREWRAALLPSRCRRKEASDGTAAARCWYEEDCPHDPVERRPMLCPHDPAWGPPQIRCAPSQKNSAGRWGPDVGFCRHCVGNWGPHFYNIMPRICHTLPLSIC